MNKTYQKSFPDNKNAGFTLIELLVVVLIIGILAAVALPQYQRAVIKSRFAAMMPLIKSLADAEERYYLANGAYTDNLADLDIEIPSFLHPTNGTFYSFTGTIYANEDESIHVGLVDNGSGSASIGVQFLLPKPGNYFGYRIIFQHPAPYHGIAGMEGKGFCVETYMGTYGKYCPWIANSEYQKNFVMGRMYPM